MVPTITSITPSTGWALGDVLVTIVGTGFQTQADIPGGRVQVLFGAAEATEVKVVSSVLIYCLAPSNDLGATDVVVSNLLADGSVAQVDMDPDPPVDETVTEVGGFTYIRQPIATPSDFSNHPTVYMIVRQIVADLRRTTLDNTGHEMHPEYVDEVGATLGQEKQAAVPSLRVVFTRAVEDRFYSTNGRIPVRGTADPALSFEVLDQPVTMQLFLDIVGTGNTPAESMNLWEAVIRYLHRTPVLRAEIGGDIYEYEMAAVFDQRGEFRGTGRQAVSTFTLPLTVRGVNLLTEAVEESWENEDDVVTTITDEVPE